MVLFYQTCLHQLLIFYVCFVTVENLSEAFQVTHQTIRRDLAYLSDNLYLARTHGGAFFQSGVSNVNHYSRQSIAQEEKIAIAKKAPP